MSAEYLSEYSLLEPRMIKSQTSKSFHTRMTALGWTKALENSVGAFETRQRYPSTFSHFQDGINAVITYLLTPFAWVLNKLVGTTRVLLEGRLCLFKIHIENESEYTYVIESKYQQVMIKTREDPALVEQLFLRTCREGKARSPIRVWMQEKLKELQHMANAFNVLALTFITTYILGQESSYLHDCVVDNNITRQETNLSLSIMALSLSANSLVMLISVYWFSAVGIECVRYAYLKQFILELFLYKFLYIFLVLSSLVLHLFRSVQSLATTCYVAEKTLNYYKQRGLAISLGIGTALLIYIFYRGFFFHNPSSKAIFRNYDLRKFDLRHCFIQAVRAIKRVHGRQFALTLQDYPAELPLSQDHICTHEVKVLIVFSFRGTSLFDVHEYSRNTKGALPMNSDEKMESDDLTMPLIDHRVFSLNE